VIRFTGVSHSYGDRAVLADIDLELSEPRIGVIGANGSGKSTLARMINGLVVPEHGCVGVNGLDTARQGREVRRQVGFIFADPDTQIVMPTVAEDVAFSLRRHRLPRADVAARVAAALARFGLAEHAEHPAHLLSSGQKQLLALAAVLVTEPQILVCDEPTTLLDLRNAERVHRLIAGLDQQVVLVTHQLALVADWDRVLVVDGGRIVADGPGRLTVPAYIELMSQGIDT
jgi:biotin transport system ATP-binding protein